MAKTRGERLRVARERLFETSRDAARALGIPFASYWQYEHAELPGGRDYGPKEAERFARRFRVSPEWLLTGRGEGIGKNDPIVPPDLSKVPVVGYVGAGARAHFHAAAPGEVDRPVRAPGSTVALEIRSESLGNIFNHWLIYYDSVRRPVTPEQIGELCVVGLADGRVLIKQLRRGRREGLFNLVSPDQSPITDVAVEWAARATNMTPAEVPLATGRRATRPKNRDHRRQEIAARISASARFCELPVAVPTILIHAGRATRSPRACIASMND